MKRGTKTIKTLKKQTNKQTKWEKRKQPSKPTLELVRKIKLNIGINNIRKMPLGKQKLRQSTKNCKTAIGTYNVSQWCNGFHWIYLVPKDKIMKH